MVVFHRKLTSLHDDGGGCYNHMGDVIDVITHRGPHDEKRAGLEPKAVEMMANRRPCDVTA